MIRGVFADRHHNSLYASLHYLFEERLGYQLFNPIGREWFTEGYWRIADIYNQSEFTIAQYLGTTTSTEASPGIFNSWDNQNDFGVSGITLSRFMETPIDIVIASVPEHIESFKKLCSLHPRHPKLIYQIGNAWPIEAGLAPNIMASAKIANVPPNVNFVEYLQEFRTDIFHPFPPVESNKIYSFINCLNTADIYKEDWPLFEETEKLMPDWEWRTYGGSCRDGSMGTAREMAEAEGSTRFLWMTKHKGDGYGHNLFNSAAVGRPVITKLSDYRGKLGEMLLRDGKTCLDIDSLSPQQIKEKILYYNQPDLYNSLCTNVQLNFREKVDFAREAEKIKGFLAKLQ